MAQNFIACDRLQELLLPPSLREWLPEDHLAWFVLDAVDAIDLSAFLAAYRVDGWGRAAHDPAMMVASARDRTGWSQRKRSLERPSLFRSHNASAQSNILRASGPRSR